MWFKQIQSDLETYFKNNWSSTPIVWENTPPPDGLNEFVRLSVAFGDAQPTDIGGRCVRILGVLFVQVFVRPGVGNARTMDLADSAVALFSAAVVNAVKFYIPTVTKLPDQEPGWYQAQVMCNFYADKEVPS